MVLSAPWEGIRRLRWASRYRTRSILRPRVIRNHGVALYLDYERFDPELIGSLHANSYETREREIVAATLSRRDTYMELGAGVGYVALTACRMLASPQQAHAYEANPALIPLLAKNCALNRSRMSISHCILGDADGEAEFWIAPDLRASSLAPRPGAERTLVPCKSFLAELERVQPTYLMVDIEGGEVELLTKPMPACVRKVCVELHPQTTGLDRATTLLATLVDRGFAVDPVVSGENVVFLRRA